MAWYQQTHGQELKFLIRHYEKSEREKGNLPSRFSVQQFDDYHSEMNMSALELEDSAMYFCASSLHSLTELLAFCNLIFLFQLVIYQRGVGWCHKTIPKAQKCF